MAATAVFSSPAMHRLCSSLESSVDSPTTQRRELKYECQSIAHFCIYNKLKTHPLAQAGSLAIPPVGQISPSMHRVAKVVQRVAGEVEKRYNTQFNDMCCKLRLTTTTAYATFAAVANEMFSSGVNWGRIAALFAFVTSLAWSLTERGHIGVVERMPDWVAQFVEKNVGEWIASKGSWVRQYILRTRGEDNTWHTPTHHHVQALCKDSSNVGPVPGFFLGGGGLIQ